MTHSDATTKMVVQYLRSRIENLEKGENVDVVAHSQGAAIVSSALSFLTPKQRSRVNLTTYGEAACAYPSGLCSVQREINVLDPVPLLAGGTLMIGSSGQQYTLFFGVFPHQLKLYIDDEKERNDPANRAKAEEARRRYIERNLDRW